ncbi:hypothetical protein B0H11DRAFT_2301063 [Mycena galericulata]|nr:hypothetical protein B0H11DRAFT_2301063 [Mycena galericulata]
MGRGSPFSPEQDKHIESFFPALMTHPTADVKTWKKDTVDAISKSPLFLGKLPSKAEDPTKGADLAEWKINGNSRTISTATDPGISTSLREMTFSGTQLAHSFPDTPPHSPTPTPTPAWVRTPAQRRFLECKKGGRGGVHTPSVPPIVRTNALPPDTARDMRLTRRSDIDIDADAEAASTGYAHRHSTRRRSAYRYQRQIMDNYRTLNTGSAKHTELQAV